VESNWAWNCYRLGYTYAGVFEQFWNTRPRLIAHVPSLVYQYVTNMVWPLDDSYAFLLDVADEQVVGIHLYAKPDPLARFPYGWVVEPDH